MSTRSPLACILPIVLAALLLNAYAQDQDSADATPGPAAKSQKSEVLLPRTIVISLKEVKEVFPEMTQQASTGPDLSAPGKPKATRAVVYASHDGTKRVTLSVDEYQYGSEAIGAYEEANRKTQLPEFEPIAISNLGQQVFAGVLKEGGETQIAITSVNDTLLVAVRLAGYEDTTDHIGKLVELGRLQEAESRAHPRGSAFRKR